MALTDKLRAIGDAIRGKTGKTEEMTLDQMAVEIDGIQTGGDGDSALELVYETEFSISETNTTSTQKDIATIQTGLSYVAGDSFWCVIECVNDTEEDKTLNHLRARTQNLILQDGSYGNPNIGSGHLYTDEYDQYGTDNCLWVRTFGKYGASLVVSTKGTSNVVGYAPSGDYTLKLYKFNNNFLGLGGVSER